jgi:hypothetical protein
MGGTTCPTHCPICPKSPRPAPAKLPTPSRWILLREAACVLIPAFGVLHQALAVPLQLVGNPVACAASSSARPVPPPSPLSYFAAPRCIRPTSPPRPGKNERSLLRGRLLVIWLVLRCGLYRIACYGGRVTALRARGCNGEGYACLWALGRSRLALVWIGGFLTFIRLRFGRVPVRGPTAGEFWHPDRVMDGCTNFFERIALHYTIKRRFKDVADRPLARHYTRVDRAVRSYTYPPGPAVPTKL